jgi:hypothetical protein
LTLTPPDGVTVSWDGYPNKIEFKGCGDTNLRYITFSSSVPGTYEITNFSMTGGKSGSQWNYETAKFKLTVTAADTTPPVISYSISGTKGNGDWYVSDVFVDWTVTDPESEVTILEGCEDTTIKYDTPGVTLICRAKSAGGTSQASVTIKRDATPPTIEWSNGPVGGGIYYFGFVPGAPTCTASDSLSGPAGCTVSGYSNAIGTHTMTATAYDNAGNKTTETRDYTVSAWTLSGFYQPVDMGGVWNIAKGGSTVPLKFEVFAGPTELTDTAYVKSFTAVQISCTTGGGEDEVEFTTTGGTSLRYDPVAGQFIQNW